MQKPFTEQDSYQKQVDIYSDEIIAIEAIRLEVLQLTQRITQAEYDFEDNSKQIMSNRDQMRLNGNEALNVKAKIDVMYQDVDDVANCLSRQWDEQKTLRAVLELYCHQFTYVAHLPYQCETILGSSKPLHSVYAWPNDPSYGGHWAQTKMASRFVLNSTAVIGKGPQRYDYKFDNRIRSTTNILWIRFRAQQRCKKEST